MSKENRSKTAVDGRSVILLIFIVVTCFFAGEFALRNMEVTDRLGFDRLPSAQDRSLIAGKVSPGQVRVVGIGDSFTVFRDLQDRNYLRFAQQMALQQNVSFDVVNLAEAGTDLHHYFRNINSSYDQLKPDIVTIGLYLGNDVGRGGLMPLEQAYSKGKISKLPESTQKDGWSDIVSLFKKSILLNYSFRILKIYIPELRSSEYEKVINYLSSVHKKDDKFIQVGLSKMDPELVKLAKSDAINPWDVGSALFSPNHYRDLYQLSTKQAVQNLRKMTDDLGFIINWLRDRDMKPIIVLLHPGIIIGERYHEYYRRLGVTLPDVNSNTTPLTNQIKKFLKQKKTLFIDSLAALRQEKGNLYIPNDTHLNSNGQRVVGRVLFDLMKENNLLMKNAFR
jgi:hypothetical protein